MPSCTEFKQQLLLNLWENEIATARHRFIIAYATVNSAINILQDTNKKALSGQIFVQKKNNNTA